MSHTKMPTISRPLQLYRCTKPNLRWRACQLIRSSLWASYECLGWKISTLKALAYCCSLSTLVANVFTCDVTTSMKDLDLEVTVSELMLPVCISFPWSLQKDQVYCSRSYCNFADPIVILIVWDDPSEVKNKKLFRVTLKRKHYPDMKQFLHVFFAVQLLYHYRSFKCRR